MTTAVTTVLLIAAAVLAVADWVAVATHRRRAEIVLKPATLALLLAAAVTADLGVTRWWVVAALAAGLAGDVALLLPTRPPPVVVGDGPHEPHDARIDGPFLLALAVFLVGHLAWIGAFVRIGVTPLGIVAGALVAVGVAGLTLPAVLRRTLGGPGPLLAAVVATYAIVLGAMAAFAAGTGVAVVAVGGLAFLVSDSLLARERFLTPTRAGPVLVIVTYHAAQFLLLLGLLHTTSGRY